MKLARASEFRGLALSVSFGPSRSSRLAGSGVGRGPFAPQVPAYVDEVVESARQARGCPKRATVP
eukprot:6756495-Alexandrium_andersonii.AAC.1